MFENKCISAFVQSRNDYDLCRRYLDTQEWTPMGSAILELVDEYYSRDRDADEVDVELLEKAIARRFEAIPRHQDTAKEFMMEVEALSTSPANVVSDILEQKRGKVRLRLADALLRQDEELIEELLPEYEEITQRSVLEDKVEEEYTNVDLSVLREKFETEGAWRISPKSLADRIKGGLRPGHAVIVAARPERGKTMVGTAMNAGFLAQGARTLYIGNEDPPPDLVIRLVSNLSGLTEDQIWEDPDTAMEVARRYGYDRCTIAGLAPGTPYEIEALVRKHKPDILFVDQMRNVKMNTENNTQRLEQVAQELRNIARRNNCVVISMTQVGDSGRDKRLLNDGDIDGSNTGIPGACDVMILVGSDDEYEMLGMRMFNLAKNKRGGNHESFPVRVDPSLSRVYSHGSMQ